MDLTTMSGPELETAITSELEQLDPRHRLYAVLRAAGQIPAVAARRAGFDVLAGLDPQERRTTAARAVIQERARRSLDVDLGWIRQRFLRLHDDATEAGDRATAKGCLVELAKLSSLYPKEPGAVAGSAPVIVQVALALPPRETPPSFLPAPAPQPVDPLS